MRILTVVELSLLFMPASSAHEYCTTAECEKAKQKIRQIQSRIRQGYTRRQGVRLEQHLGKLHAIRRFGNDNFVRIDIVDPIVPKQINAALGTIEGNALCLHLSVTQVIFNCQVRSGVLARTD